MEDETISVSRTETRMQDFLAFHEQKRLWPETLSTIHDLHAQGKSVQEIAQELSISRTTVRKYLKHPEAVIRKARPPRPSKLDPFKEQIKQWVMEDHCTNCEVIFVRLQKLG
jgi:transposase